MYSTNYAMFACVLQVFSFQTLQNIREFSNRKLIASLDYTRRLLLFDWTWKSSEIKLAAPAEIEIITISSSKRFLIAASNHFTLDV